MKKKIKLINITVLVIIALVLAACSSSPPPQQRPPNPNERLITAASNKNLSSVRSAIESGANVNTKSQQNGATPLLLASSGENANIEIIRYLLENGADINARNNAGNTALHIAISWDNYTIARLLIDNGININARDNNGKTALNWAYERGEMTLYDYLIANGAREFEPLQVTQQPSAPAPAPSSASSSSPPPSSSSGSSSSSSSLNSAVRDVADSVNRAFQAPIQNGTYRMSGRSEQITFAGIASAGNLSYRDATGTTQRGTYTIEGNRLTIYVANTYFFYTITSSTSFTGHGETWIRTGF